MALVNMQLQQRFNHFLPQFEHDFTNEIAKSDIFDCYGMHLEVPELTYFQGGFMIKGDYNQIPVNELACGNVTANSTELLSLSQFLPDKLSGKFQQLDKAFAFLEVAAKKGSIYAHKCLAINHKEAGNNQLSIDHWKVAANAGDQVAMDNLMKAYKEKSISKEDLTKTLRAFQTSSNEMKSTDRDIARMLEEAIANGEEPSAELLDRLEHGVFKRSCKD